MLCFAKTHRNRSLEGSASKAANIIVTPVENEGLERREEEKDLRHYFRKIKGYLRSATYYGHQSEITSILLKIHAIIHR